MISVLSAPDAVAVAALISVLGTAIVNLRNSQTVAKNMRPNGGSRASKAVAGGVYHGWVIFTWDTPV